MRPVMSIRITCGCSLEISEDNFGTLVAQWTSCNVSSQKTSELLEHARTLVRLFMATTFYSSHFESKES